jgi:hypothetical protein
MRGVSRFRRKRRDPWKRMTELWIVADAPRIPVALLRVAARAAGVEPQVWPAI